jgi:hypothetical protein
MLPQRYVMNHKGRSRYVRFCRHIIFDLPEVLVFCGDGYHNHGRKVTKGVPYCRHHLNAHAVEWKVL